MFVFWGELAIVFQIKIIFEFGKKSFWLAKLSKSKRLVWKGEIGAQRSEIPPSSIYLGRLITLCRCYRTMWFSSCWLMLWEKDVWVPNTGGETG
jgi:hypothetical protein